MNMLIGRTFAQTFQLLESVKQHSFLFLSSDSGETAYARISQLRPGWDSTQHSVVKVSRLQLLPH